MHLSSIRYTYVVAYHNPCTNNMHCQTIGHIGSIQKVEFFFQMVSIVLLGSVLEVTSDMA